MTLREPTSMDECVYFTNRASDKGKARAWVFREQCPKCHEGLMGKPRDPKTGKPKIRAEEYVCPKCAYTASLEEYEDTLTANVQYTCQKCEKSGEIQIPYQRKKVKIFDEEDQKERTAEALQFQCEHCNEKINITKKMR